MNYEDADLIANNVGRGLRVLGQQSNQPLCIFADTRAEWNDMVESLVMIDLIKPISRKTEDVVQKTRQSIAQHSALEQKISAGRDKVYRSEQEALDKLLEAAR